jgi:catalase
MWAMSDRAIPLSFRTMEGFGIHTFQLVNADGKSTFVKFHPDYALPSVTKHLIADRKFCVVS